MIKRMHTELARVEAEGFGLVLGPRFSGKTPLLRASGERRDFVTAALSFDRSLHPADRVQRAIAYAVKGKRTAMEVGELREALRVRSRPLRVALTALETNIEDWPTVRDEGLEIMQLCRSWAGAGGMRPSEAPLQLCAVGSVPWSYFLSRAEHVDPELTHYDWHGGRFSRIDVEIHGAAEIAELAPHWKTKTAVQVADWAGSHPFFVRTLVAAAPTDAEAQRWMADGERAAVTMFSAYRSGLADAMRRWNDDRTREPLTYALTAVKQQTPGALVNEPVEVQTFVASWALAPYGPNGWGPTAPLVLEMLKSLS